MHFQRVRFKAVAAPAGSRRGDSVMLAHGSHQAIRPLRTQQSRGDVAILWPIVKHRTKLCPAVPDERFTPLLVKSDNGNQLIKALQLHIQLHVAAAKNEARGEAVGAQGRMDEVVSACTRRPAWRRAVQVKGLNRTSTHAMHLCL